MFSEQSERRRRLERAVLALDRYGAGARLARALQQGQVEKTAAFDALPEPSIDKLIEAVRTLEDRGVDAIMLDDQNFPDRLATVKDSPPLLFYWGNQDLLNSAGIGMCGSRHVSAQGLRAARTAGLEVASQGLAIISGYARGVDTETHLAALGSGGSTLIVLAEGILHFRKKAVFNRVGLDPDRVLILSQFPPSQTWNAGAAMARNAVIVGLGRALVVVEAGETGGTWNAAERALRMGRPVLALEFAQEMPVGNKLLIEKGAVPIRSPDQLSRVVEAISNDPTPAARQLTML